jgi:hypothetical protein
MMTLNRAKNKVFTLRLSDCYGERANIAKYFFRTKVIKGTKGNKSFL